MIAKFAQTAGIAAGTALATSAVFMAVQPEPSPVPKASVSVTGGLFGGTLVAPGMSERVVAQELGVASGVSGTVTTVERAVLFPAEGIANLFPYAGLTIGILNDSYNNFSSTVNGHTVSEDGLITRLTVTTARLDGDRLEYSFEILVDGQVVSGPLLVSQCVDGRVAVLDLPPVAVSAGEQLTIRFTESPAVCQDLPGFDNQLQGPFIIDIERERVVQPGLPGDVNGDGAVNFTDLIATLFLFDSNRARSV